MKNGRKSLYVFFIAFNRYFKYKRWPKYDQILVPLAQISIKNLGTGPICRGPK